MDAYAGELAAIGTAWCWAFTVLFFTAAGERIGSLTVNLLRLVMAFAMLMVFGLFTRGLALPLDASLDTWLWLSLSGLVGFTFGDLCLFRAFLMVGPRVSSLMMSLAPPLTALIGWLLLGETLSGLQWFGMLLTLGGISWAIADRTPQTRVQPKLAQVFRGLALAFGGALGQAVGLVLSKLGMRGYDAFASTQIRILAGTVGFCVIFTVLRRWPSVWKAFEQPRALLYTGLGSLFGPFIGVSLSLVAVTLTTTGVAASLIATSPVFILPLVVFWRGERVGVVGWAGACLAVLGVAVLFASA